MHKLDQSCFYTLRNVVRQSPIILYLFAVDFKLHILDAQVSRFCIVSDGFQHIGVFRILHQPTGNIRIVAGEEYFIPEPAHCSNAGRIVHGTRHRKEELVFGDHIPNHSPLDFILCKREFLLRAFENQRLLPFGRMIEIF